MINRTRDLNSYLDLNLLNGDKINDNSINGNKILTYSISHTKLESNASSGIILISDGLGHYN